MADLTRALLSVALAAATLMAAVPARANSGTVTLQATFDGRTAGPGQAATAVHSDGVDWPTITATVTCMPGCGPVRWYVDGNPAAGTTTTVELDVPSPGVHRIEVRTAVGDAHMPLYVAERHADTLPTFDGGGHPGRHPLWAASAAGMLDPCTLPGGNIGLCPSPSDPPAGAGDRWGDCGDGIVPGPARTTAGAERGCLTRRDVATLAAGTHGRTDLRCADGSDPQVAAAIDIGLLDGPACHGAYAATVGQLWDALLPPSGSPCGLDRWRTQPRCGAVADALDAGAPTGQPGCADPGCVDPSATTTRQAAAELWLWLAGSVGGDGPPPVATTVDGRSVSAATFGGRTADVTIAGDGCGRLTNTVGPTDAVTLVCPDGPATTVDVTVADRTVTVAVPAAAPPTGQPEPVVVDPVTVAAGDAVTVDLDTSYRRSLPDDGAQVAIGQASRVRLLGSRRTRALVVGDRAGRDVVTLRACDGNGCQQVPLQVTVEASDGVPGLVTDMSLLTGNHVVAAATASGGTDVTVEAGDGNVRTVCVRDEHPGLGGLADNCLRGRVLAGLIRGAAVQP